MSCAFPQFALFNFAVQVAPLVVLSEGHPVTVLPSVLFKILAHLVALLYRVKSFGKKIISFVVDVKPYDRETVRILRGTLLIFCKEVIGSSFDFCCPLRCDVGNTTCMRAGRSFLRKS